MGATVRLSTTESTKIQERRRNWALSRNWDFVIKDSEPQGASRGFDAITGG